MSASNKQFHYSVAKGLHWVAGAIIAFNLLSAWRLGEFSVEVKQVLLMIHSGVGTVIFLMMLFRLWWRNAHRLYAPPRWWKRPSMVLQVLLYPLVLTQVVIGVAMASVIDIEVLGLGFIPYSAIAADNEALHELFLQMHVVTAWVLIVLIVAHGIERYRIMFADDASEVPVQQPAKP